MVVVAEPDCLFRWGSISCRQYRGNMTRDSSLRSVLLCSCRCDCRWLVGGGLLIFGACFG